MGYTHGHYNMPGLHWVDVPLTPDSPGNENEVARQGDYFYYYDTDNSLWRRIESSIDWSNTTTTTTT